MSVKQQSKDHRAVFFDTEFTGLFDAPALISIGLIDVSGRHVFYAEATGNWQPQDCSEFCRSEVLPLLQGGEAAMPLAVLRKKLTQWLKRLKSQVTLLSDSPRDLEQLARLFPRGLPGHVRARTFGTYDQLTRQIFNGRRQIHHRNGWRAHHALDDARANRIAWLKGRFNSAGWAGGPDR